MRTLRVMDAVARAVVRPTLRAFADFRAAGMINRLPNYFENGVMSDFFPRGAASSTGDANYFRSRYSRESLSYSGVYERPLVLYSVEVPGEDTIGFRTYEADSDLINANLRLLRFEYPGTGEIDIPSGILSAAAQGFLQERVISRSDSRIDLIVNTFPVKNGNLRREMVFDLAWQLGAKPYGMLYAGNMGWNLFLWTNIGQGAVAELQRLEALYRNSQPAETDEERTGLSAFIRDILGNQLSAQMRFKPFNAMEF